MRSLVWLIVVGLLLVAGCDEAAPEVPDRPVEVKPEQKPVVLENARPAEESTLVLPEFIEYKTVLFADRNRPLFDDLVHFETGCAKVEPYLLPVHARLRLDWNYLIENTRLMDLALLNAINEHLDTALDQAPKGGGVPVFGEEFHLDLVRLQAVARKLYWASQAQDLEASRRHFKALRVLLGPRKAVQGEAGRNRSQPAARAPEVDTSVDDTLLKGKLERYSDIGKLRPPTNIRAEYAFWPAPVSVKTEYLATDPKPVTLNWAMNMDHSPDFDTPQWPQPAIINTRDLRQENEYAKRISTVEVR